MSNMIELPGSLDKQLSPPPQDQKPLEPMVEAPIQQDPEKLGGHPTIGSNRVQADVLINYLANGATIHDFLADYDAVTEEEVRAVLSVIRQAILDEMLTGVRARDENTF